MLTVVNVAPAGRSCQFDPGAEQSGVAREGAPELNGSLR